MKAVSSPLRLQILNLLFDKGPLSYTELMSSLKMNPGRDAGKFAYHLKFLLKTDLVEVNAEARRYTLTEMGKMVIDVADRIDKRALKSKNTLVRTSRLALEEFDATKIANSLIREAQMPADLAQKISKEAEKNLLHSKTKYLTAPLVREVVNAILIQDGLEDYRNRLTRLGVPVHDVTDLLQSNHTMRDRLSIAELAGRAVLKEYTLLHVLPRDVSDAHLSGSLNIDNLSTWLMKPAEIMHDLRFFIENGINFESTDYQFRSYPPPQDLETALDMIFNALLYTREEVDGSQTVDYFNIFLAPFAADLQQSKIKQLLSLFIQDLSRHVRVTLGLELSTPSFLEGKPAYGIQGKRVGKYKDFEDQSKMVASLLIDVITELSANTSMSEPTLVVKIRSHTADHERASALLLKAHKLASETGLVSFANCLKKDDVHTVFSSSGFGLTQDVDGDWETDTLRTGLLGTVTINMPRLILEAGNDKVRLGEILKERVEMANRAIEVKYASLKNNFENLLPFLSQRRNGDRYFRIEGCSRIVNIAGFKEAVEIFSEKSITDEKSLSFASELAQTMSSSIRKVGRRRGKRLSPALLLNVEAGERLAYADIGRYGIAKVKFSGTRDRPFYSTTIRSSFNATKLGEENLVFYDRSRELVEGGTLTIVELNDPAYEPSDLMTISKQLLENHNVRFLTYERKLTHCAHCNKSWFGLLRKCPTCGAIGTLAFSNRFCGA